MFKIKAKFGHYYTCSDPPSLPTVCIATQTLPLLKSVRARAFEIGFDCGRKIRSPAKTAPDPCKNSSHVMCFRYERVPLGLRCVPAKVLVMFYGFFLWLFHCLSSFFRSYKTTSWAMCIRISHKIATIIPFCHHCTAMLERTVPFFDRACSGSVFPPEAMCWSFDLLFKPCLQPTFLAIDPCRFLRVVGRKEKKQKPSAREAPWSNCTHARARGWEVENELPSEIGSCSVACASLSTTGGGKNRSTSAVRSTGTCPAPKLRAVQNNLLTRVTVNGR